MKLELIQPNSWNDLTFNQYKRLLKLVLEEDSTDPINILKLRLKQMAVINPDYTVEELGKLRATQVIEYYKTIDFIDNEPVKEIFNEFILDHKKFRQIKFNDLSMAQWIDAEKFSSDILDHNKLIAIFYIQPDEYNDMIRDRVAEYLDNLPAPKVFYLVSQFFFIQTALEKALVDYSAHQAKMMKRVQRVIEKTRAINEKVKRVQKWFGFKSYTT